MQREKVRSSIVFIYKTKWSNYRYSVVKVHGVEMYNIHTHTFAGLILMFNGTLVQVGIYMWTLVQQFQTFSFDT